MRKTLPLLATVALLALFATGCANMQSKLGRGMTNTGEILRLGEFRRTTEMATLNDGPTAGYSSGFVKGLSRSLARTGIGIYEVVTSPLPPYGPVFTDTFTVSPVYPDNYQPDIMEDALYATDTNLGFSGGDIAPMMPGSRFRIFDTH